MALTEDSETAVSVSKLEVELYKMGRFYAVQTTQLINHGHILHSMDDDPYPFSVGFDDDVVVIIADEEAYTIDPDNAETLAADLREMAEEAREFESPDNA